MESTVWKFTMESIVHSILKEYGNYNTSLLMPELTVLCDSSAFHDLYVFALLRFVVVKTAYVLFLSF